MIEKIMDMIDVKGFEYNLETGLKPTYLIIDPETREHINHFAKEFCTVQVKDEESFEMFKGLRIAVLVSDTAFHLEVR